MIAEFFDGASRIEQLRNSPGGKLGTLPLFLFFIKIGEVFECISGQRKETSM
jgi:hypothetical protein